MLKYFLLFVTLGFSPLLMAQKELCESTPQNPEYTRIQSLVEKKITAFAQLPVVAKNADATLSKLIAAKSPVLLSWMKSRDLDTQSETEIALAWRQYYAKNFVLAKYPHPEPEITSAIDTLFSDINAAFGSAAFKEKMQKLFATAKNDLIAMLQTLPLAEKDKNQIRARVENIQLYWMTKLSESKFKQMPLEFLDWGIAYDPVKNEINIGLHALAYPNDETLLSVFAHEMGHSFDSCRWGAFFDGKWPFEKVASCLRSSESVGAKTRDDSRLGALAAANRISKDLVAALKLNPTCNKSSYPPPGVQADQLPESFADWVSAEVMARTKLADRTKIRLDLCASKKLIDGSSYPSNSDRLRKIYFVQPELSKALGAPGKTAKYCSL